MAVEMTELEQGKELLTKGDINGAISCFRRGSEGNFRAHSWVAYCLALETGDIEIASSICLGAVRSDPKDSEIYFNLGRIYLLGGKKKAAIRIFRLGLRNGRNDLIIVELAKLGIRRPPPIRFLKRENPINKYLGLLLKRLGLR